MLRGIGPARQSEHYGLEQLFAHFSESISEEAVGPVRALSKRGPLHPLGCCVMASFFMLREIEASLARREHVMLDFARQQVHWLLPASKTDPSAAGVERTWGCVCAGSPAGRRPCPWHAAVAHERLLQRTFSQEALSAEGFPWLPSADGSVVAKEDVVLSIELLVAFSGRPVLTPDGHRRFGGHSHRVEGARMLARMGMEIYKIQLMARWSSAVVMRYVGTAPLDSMTADAVRLASRSAADEAVAGLRASVAELRRDFRERADAPGAPAPEAVHQASHVLNVRTSVLHGTHSRTEDPPELWKTLCGWSFGLRPHRRLPLPPPGVERCRACFPGCASAATLSAAGA